MWSPFKKRKSRDPHAEDTELEGAELDDKGDAEPKESGGGLPSAVANALPEGERGGPHTMLEDGRHVVVGNRVLAVVDGAGAVEAVGFWHEVQYASWKADTQTLTVVWTDPKREPLVAATRSENPKRFMEALTLRVDNTIVATRSFTTSGGTNVAATVRRRVDGHLFSAVVVSGPVSEDDERKALALEQELRSELNMED